MKFLVDIPIVMSFAEWVWSDDPSDDVSPKQCIESLGVSLMNAGCWSRLVAKGLGIAIVLAACLNKAPVIRNILANKSTAGLARYSMYGDCIVYSNMAFYGIKEGHPLTAFGENVALLLQSLAIVLLIWKFENKPNSVGFMERAMAILFGVLYTLAIFLVLPNELNYLLISSTWPMYVSSRGSQIYHTAFVAKHTGAQSLITLSMNLLGNCVRILTTIKEVGMDFALLGAYFMGGSINLILIGQYLYYQENTRLFLQQLQDEEKEKKEKKA